jgi:hypothetical protein
MGEAEGFNGFPPVDGVAVNELRAIVATGLDKVEGAGDAGGFQAFQRPGMGLV